jgi:hypothetical protein
VSIGGVGCSLPSADLVSGGEVEVAQAVERVENAISVKSFARE